MEFLGMNLLCVVFVSIVALLVYCFTRSTKRQEIQGEEQYADHTAWRQIYNINEN